MKTDHRIISLGPARLTVEPVDYFLWQALAVNFPGRAELCLKLLPLALRDWRNVREEDGQAAEPGRNAFERLPAASAGLLLPGLCAPLFTQAEDAALCELEKYLKARVDYPGLECASCREQAARGEGGPDCERCPLPQPPSLAEPVFSLAALMPGAEQGESATALLKGLGPGRVRLMLAGLALLKRYRGMKNQRTL